MSKRLLPTSLSDLQEEDLNALEAAAPRHELVTWGSPLYLDYALTELLTLVEKLLKHNKVKKVQSERQFSRSVDVEEVIASNEQHQYFEKLDTACKQLFSADSQDNQALNFFNTFVVVRAALELDNCNDNTQSVIAGESQSEDIQTIVRYAEATLVNMCLSSQITPFTVFIKLENRIRELENELENISFLNPHKARKANKVSLLKQLVETFNEQIINGEQDSVKALNMSLLLVEKTNPQTFPDLKKGMFSKRTKAVLDGLLGGDPVVQAEQVKYTCQK